VSVILKNPPQFGGCDFVLQLGEERAGTKIRVLQITDMQFIDAAQRRTPDRLREDEIRAWAPSLLDANGGDQIRSLAAQVRPDLIIITGDIIYGSFDDAGTTMRWFCSLMDSLEIPWAPVWGNHDNESGMGVGWQCAQFAASRYCLFDRGNVSGNSNYTVGIACGDTLVRVLYMLDSGGCRGTDPSLIREPGLRADQLAMMRERAAMITAAQGRSVPAFMAFHIPAEQFMAAEIAKGYRADETSCYVLGVDTVPQDGDFGCCLEKYKYQPFRTTPDFPETLRACGVDGIFVGHYHAINTCISYGGIHYVFGLKTGQYDYHSPYQLGGTRITLEGGGFEVSHVPALARLAPLPGGSPIFRGFFAETEAASAQT